MPDLQCDYYDCIKDQDVLTNEDPDEAVEEYLEECEPLPETVTVYGFKRRVVDWVPEVLDRLLEDLDDEYGGEDTTEATTGMIDARDVFLAAVLAEYHVYQCEYVKGSDIVVNVAEWVKANRLDWLEGR